MKYYLVGGAVRDNLLNRPVVDKDWVVVGASLPEMKTLGFTQVGKGFAAQRPDDQRHGSDR